MTEQEAKEILSLTPEEKAILTNLIEVYEIAIQALEDIQKYRMIGTVEECRTAREMQIPKKPNRITDELQIRYTDSYHCQNCDKGFAGTGIANFCYHCGQAIDWRGVD